MSGVPERKRKLSEYEFFRLAMEINVEVHKMMASESVVPKRHRFLVGVPTAETAREILVNVNRADAFYPNSSFNVQQRRYHLTLAIAGCEQLLLDLQTILDMGLPPNARRFEDLVLKIDKEISLLKGARKNVKVVGGRSHADLLDEAEREVSRLRDIVDEDAMV